MTEFLVHIGRRALYATIVCLVLSRGAAVAAPVFLFDFEADGGQATPYTSPSNGVSATFSSPAFPFFVEPTLAGSFVLLSGNALFQFLPGSTLNILFSQDIQFVQLDFGSTNPGTLTLTAFDQGGITQVGQSSAVSSILPGGTNPEGSLSFEGSTALRSLTLDFTSSDPNATFAIDNVTNGPEPASMLLFGLGLIALTGARRFRSQP